MTAAPKPANEIERLDALRSYAVLDTQAEKMFDDIAKLASDICAVPIALISLVDEKRQWFLSKVGIDTTQTDRDDSLCAHAILHDDGLEIPDTLLDARFSDNPMPNMRFYCGSPLVNAEGLVLGTLCVIDTQPRRLSQTQRESLTTLSRHVVMLLEYRRVLRTLRFSVDSTLRAHTELAHKSGQLNKLNELVVQRVQPELEALASGLSQALPLSADVIGPLHKRLQGLQAAVATGLEAASARPVVQNWDLAGSAD